MVGAVTFADLLKVIIQGLVTVYGFIIVGTMLSLGEIGALIAEGEAAKIWFIAGIGLIVAGLHLNVTSMLFSQYMRLVSAIRANGTA